MKLNVSPFDNVTMQESLLLKTQTCPRSQTSSFFLTALATVHIGISKKIHRRATAVGRNWVVSLRFASEPYFNRVQGSKNIHIDISICVLSLNNGDLYGYRYDIFSGKTVWICHLDSLDVPAPAARKTNKINIVYGYWWLQYKAYEQVFIKFNLQIVVYYDVCIDVWFNLAAQT